MKIIEITKGFKVAVDDEDYEWLSEYKWQVSSSSKSSVYYAVGRVNEKMFTCIG